VNFEVNLRVATADLGAASAGRRLLQDGVSMGSDFAASLAAASGSGLLGSSLAAAAQQSGKRRAGGVQTQHESELCPTCDEPVSNRTWYVWSDDLGMSVVRAFLVCT
jgi:hypothetical protein